MTLSSLIPNTMRLYRSLKSLHVSSMKSAPRVSDAAERKGINMGFLLGGYSSDEPLGESWSVEIKNGVAGHPVELRKKHDPGISWGGQGEVLSRIVQGYSP